MHAPCLRHRHPIPAPGDVRYPPGGTQKEQQHQPYGGEPGDEVERFDLLPDELIDRLPIADLAPAMLTLGGERPGGVVHLTNAGAVSWYEFVREILADVRAEGDAALIALSVERPESREELARIRGFPRPLMAGKASSEILARISRATAEPAEMWPEVRAAR